MRVQTGIQSWVERKLRKIWLEIYQDDLETALLWIWLKEYKLICKFMGDLYWIQFCKCHIWTKDKHPTVWSTNLIYGTKYSRMDQYNLRKTTFKKLKWYGLLRHITSNFVKAVFHNFYLVCSWILCPIYGQANSFWLLLLSRPYYWSC